MQAPTLSKSQRNKALKKKPIKKSVRNILSRPKTLTWPLISDVDAIAVKKKLKELFYCEKRHKVPWSLLKNVPKEERKTIRTEIINSRTQQTKSEYLKHAILGINAVIRGLERKMLTSVLLSSDVNPPEIVRHIWHFCDNSHLPIIAVPFLRKTMTEVVGFPVLVLGLKIVPKDNPVYNLYEIICDFDSKFTGRSYPYTEIVELDDSFESEEILEKCMRKREEMNINGKDVYLYRDSVTTRCFIPPRSQGSDASTGFMSFNTEEFTDISRLEQTTVISIESTMDATNIELSKTVPNNSIVNTETQMDIDSAETQKTNFKNVYISPIKQATDNCTPDMAYTQSTTKSLEKQPKITKKTKNKKSKNNASNTEQSNSVANSSTDVLLAQLNDEISLREKGSSDNLNLKPLGKVLSTCNNNSSNQQSPRKKRKSPVKLSYLPLKMKRIQSNPNRKKKKK